MSRFKKYYQDQRILSNARPGQVQRRAFLLEDLERESIAAAKDRFIDLFGLSLWEECSMVRSPAEFWFFCKKYDLHI